MKVEEWSRLMFSSLQYSPFMVFEGDHLMVDDRSNKSSHVNRISSSRQLPKMFNAIQSLPSERFPR